MRTWSPLQNSFLIGTANSFRQCLKIADYTLATLQGQDTNPYLDALHTRLLPIADAYRLAYTTYHTAITKQKALVKVLAQDFKTLQSTKIMYWDIHIQQLFAQGTPEYQLLLPYRRKPYQNGSQEDRISSVGVLALALATVPQLAAIYTDVVAFRDVLNTNYNLKQQQMSRAEGSNTALEAARVAVCQELYYIQAMLMAHYYKEPHRVDIYFDTKSLRQHRQTHYNKCATANTSKLVLTHTFAEEDKIRIVNHGAKQLVFKLCRYKTDAVAEPWLLVNPHTEVVVPITDLGDVDTDRYLKVRNPSATIDADYSLVRL